MSKKGDQEPLNNSEARYRSLVAQLIRPDDEERALVDAERFRHLVVPWTPPHVLTNIATRTKTGNWPRRRARNVWELLSAHLVGGRALGGVHTQVQFLVQDLDAGDISPLETRLAVARLVWPRSILVRSSDSGGLHVIGALPRPQSVHAVLHLAHERLRKAAFMLDHQFYERLACSPIEGVDRLFELHPRPWPQGSVIRVPFGTGSYVLDDNLRPLHTTAGQGIRLFLEWFDAQPHAELHEAFPHDDVARVVLPPRATAAARRWPPHREARSAALAGDAGQLRDERPRAGAQVLLPPLTGAPAHSRRRAAGRLLQLHACCHGALPASERGTMDDCREYATCVARDGLLADATRNAATHTLAYVAIVGDGLDVDRAHARIWPILQRSSERSKDVRKRPRPTEHRTKKIIEGYHKRHLERGGSSDRPFKLIQGGRPYGKPLPVHLSDWVHTLDLFDGDGYLSGSWLRILRFARANRYEPTLGSGYWVSPLPLEGLELRGSRGRKALKTFIDMQLLVPYKSAIRKVRRKRARGSGPGGDKYEGAWRQLRAAEYRVRWRFLGIGPEVAAPRAVSGIAASRIRAKVHVLIAEVGTLAQQFVNPQEGLAVSSLPLAVGESRVQEAADSMEPCQHPGEARDALLPPRCPASSELPEVALARRAPPELVHPEFVPCGVYADAVLALARQISGRANRPGERALAIRLWNRGWPLHVAEAGIRLTELRRHDGHDGQAPTPTSVSSLAYYIPAMREVEELRDPDVISEYCTYLRREMATNSMRPQLVLLRPAALPSRREYERRAIRLYVSLPGTPARASKGDWKEARSLYRQAIPLEAVEAGIIEVLARRLLRHAPLAGRVRTFHYFRRAILEVAAGSIEPARVAYLRERLMSVTS